MKTVGELRKAIENIPDEVLLAGYDSLTDEVTPGINVVLDNEYQVEFWPTDPIDVDE